MKKTLLLILVGILLPMAVFAGKLTQEKALQIAQQFLKENGMPTLDNQRDYAAGDSEERGYFVFNSEKGGFVIVAGDDRFPTAVLGYSKNGRFNYNELPPNAKAWMDGYTEEIKALETMPEGVLDKAEIDYGTSVSPLLGDIEWGQDRPYNLLCPKLGTELTVTGCVATATAQIMYYHRWPNKGKGSVSYTTDTRRFRLSANFAQSTYNWDAMKPTYNSSSSTASQNAVALLMRDVGYAYYMDYDTNSNGGSGAYTSDAVYVLPTYFGYDANTIQLAYRSDKTDAQWSNILKNELDNKRPILYSGRGTGGHAFVCDGYDANGYFHFNFGWDGWCNAYMSFTSIRPSGYNFTQSQFAVCGIQPGEIPVTNVRLDKTTLRLDNGTSEKLTATITPDNATTKTVTWSSSNTAVATVSSTGSVKAVGAGSATITCASTAYPNIKATCRVTVVNPIYVSSITLSKTELVFEEGAKKQKLTATIKPTNATNKNVIWTSSNPSVATVDEQGYVTPLAIGTAVITCRSVSDPSIAPTCQVTVKKKEIKVTRVKLDKTTLKLEKGTSQALTATITPDNATTKTVTWSSSNTAVATVSSTGNVQAVGAGSAIITCASTAYPNVKATCRVTVVIPILVESIKLSKTELTFEYGARKLKLTATIRPTNATNKAVTWTSSNPSVATVDEQGYVTPLAIGSATITCRSVSTPGISETCQVRVQKSVKSLTLSSTTLRLAAGNMMKLSVTVNPDDATDKSVTWTSNNPKIATVDQYGNVSAVSRGSAVITCQSVSNPNIKKTCRVTVIASTANAAGEKDAEATRGAEKAIGQDAFNMQGTMDIQDGVKPFDVFDLNGRKVRSQVYNLDGLPQGVYIINGKKVKR